MDDALNLLLQSLIIPAAFSVLILPLGKVYKQKSGWIVFLVLLYPTIIYSYITLNLFTGFIKDGIKASYVWAPYIGNLTLLADGLSAPIAFTIALLSALIAIYSIGYMAEAENIEVYYSLYLLYAVGMLGTVLTTNLAAFFLFFELMLIPSWALIAVWGTGPKEAIAFKYFMFTEAGALSLLTGILITRFQFGTFEIFDVALKLTPEMEKIAVIIVTLILLGLIVKMAIFPLHTWLPDAHAEAPTPISALLSPAMIGIGGYAAIRIIYTAFPIIVSNYNFIIATSILALITMFYGASMALVQEDVKRLLAYSSISQMGYLLFGVASTSILGLTGAALLYMSHGFAKAVLFMISGIFIHQFHTRKISDLGGLAAEMPYTATAALISFLSLAGTPPFLGFWGELFIFAGAMHSSLLNVVSQGLTRVVITALAVIASIFTAGYGLKAFRKIFFGERKGNLKAVTEGPLTMLAPIIILAALSFILGIYPTLISKELGAFFSQLIP